MTVEITGYSIQDGIVTIEAENCDELNYQRLQRIRDDYIQRTIEFVFGIRDGFILKDPEQAVSPTVYLDEEQLQKSDAELVQFLINVHAHSDRPDLVAVQNFMEKYCILNHVLPRLYDASNEAMMKERGIAFTKLPDLGLLVGYYLVISKSGDGTASVTLKQSHLSYVSLDVSDLYDEAVKNLASIATIENMNSLLGRISGIRMDDELPMWVISNENHLQGAAAILCQSVIEMIKQRIGLRFYILPSSVCEVIAVPFQTGNADVLLSMVTEINHSMVSDQDRLCDRVFVYDGEKLW